MGSTACAMPSDTEVAFYRTFGFLHRRAQLSDTEVHALREELNHAHANLRHLETLPALALFAARQLQPMLRQTTPLAASLPEDERFGGVAEQLQGRSYLCAVNSYVLRGGTSWHPDFERELGEFGQCDGLVMAVYLEPLDGSDGALRVLPGSHVNPLHAEVYELVASEAMPYGGTASEWPAHVCSCEPNGAR